MDTKHGHDLLDWTPAPNPWRTLRRAAAAVVLGSLLAWGILALPQYLPARSLDAPKVTEATQVDVPNAVTDVPKAQAVVEERPAEVHAVATTKPTVRTGSVVKDVTDREVSR